MEFFGAKTKHEILGDLPNTICEYTPVFLFGVGKYPKTNDEYYEWKNIIHTHYITSKSTFRIPRNICITETDVSVSYPTEKKVADILANYPQILFKNTTEKPLLKMMERDDRVNRAVNTITSTSRVYVDGDYYHDILITFEYNVIETVKEYFHLLRGEDPSLLDYYERMEYLPKFCKMCGVFIGTTDAAEQNIFWLFNGKYRLKEHTDFVEYHSMIPKFSEMKATSLNIEEERYQNAIMITITTETPPRLICADIYRDFKYVEHNQDIGMSVLSLYGYPFPMKHPPEEISYIVSNYEVYVQTLDITNCERFPIRLSRLLEVIRERIEDNQKIVIYPFLTMENTTTNHFIQDTGIQNIEKIKSKDTINE